MRCAKCKNSWHAAPADIMRKQQAAPARAASAPPRPAHKPVGFDGKLDEQSAADTASLRRSVQGTLGAEVAPKERPDEDMFDEGVEAPPQDDTADDMSGGDDFGISARFKNMVPTDGDTDFEDDGTEPDGPDADDFEDEDYDEDDFLVRRRADQRKQSAREIKGRRRKIMTGAWAILIIFWLAVLYAFVFQKELMRSDFPGTAEFVYGLFEGTTDKERFRPKDGEPLTRSPAEAEVYFRAALLGMAVEVQDGEQVLVVRGYVENAGTTGANVPKVNVTVSDRNGKQVDSWNFDPPGRIIRRGQKLNFVEARSPVPAGAYQAEVKVLEGTKSTTEGQRPEGIH